MDLNVDARDRVARFKEAFRDNPHALLGAIPTTDVDAWKKSHIHTIELRRNHRLPSEAAADEKFLKALHQLLIDWYGNRSWHIVDYDDMFRCKVKEAAKHLDRLNGYRIEDAMTTNVTCELWDVIAKLRVTNAEARIVSGTKTIHHLVPNLIPPMDNQYTGDFFLGYGVGQGGYTVFRRMYSTYVHLARCLRIQLIELEAKFRADRNSFNTSIPKILDNAVIGFMKLESRITDIDH